MSVEYDSWPDLYDAWIDTAPICIDNKPFYVEEYLRADGPAVELGVGNGRILIEAARAGRHMVGVDSSPAMMELCRERAAAADVARLVELILADFRSFQLPEPAALITIPFHTIGLLVSTEDKRDGLRQIHSQLRPGGQLILDHFIFNPETAKKGNGVVRLRTMGRKPSGQRFVLWNCNNYGFEQQTIDCVIWTDELDDSGVVTQRRYHDLSFSWSTPEQMRGLFLETGFEIEAVYGDFDRRPLDDSAREQIWVVRKPS